MKGENPRRPARVVPINLLCWAAQGRTFSPHWWWIRTQIKAKVILSAYQCWFMPGGDRLPPQHSFTVRRHSFLVLRGVVGGLEPNPAVSRQTWGQRAHTLNKNVNACVFASIFHELNLRIEDVFPRTQKAYFSQLLFPNLCSWALLLGWDHPFTSQVMRTGMFSASRIVFWFLPVHHPSTSLQRDMVVLDDYNNGPQDQSSSLIIPPPPWAPRATALATANRFCRLCNGFLRPTARVDVPAVCELNACYRKIT